MPMPDGSLELIEGSMTSFVAATNERVWEEKERLELRI